MVKEMVTLPLGYSVDRAAIGYDHLVIPFMREVTVPKNGKNHCPISII